MDVEKLISELTFKAVRSSGAGGQHVNKTSSKVEVTFNVEVSEALSEEEKNRLREKLASKITNEGNIILQCDESRSQHKNKKLVIDRLVEYVKENLKVKKKRKKSKPSKAAIQKRLDAKKQQAEKKANRKPPKLP